MSSGGDRSSGGWSEEPPGELPAPSLDGRRYLVEGPLGEGGMGEVVRAWDAHLGRPVALKRLRADRPDPSLAARLLREARLTAHLDHPGVVPALDVGRDEEGRLFYTMRLVRGRTLGAAAVDLPLPQLLRHLLHATQAVAYAHAHGVVHRDLKPDNVMVGPFGETQVVDWGLAARIGSSDEHPPPDGGPGLEEAGTLTRLGRSVGTPGFMSPEQARGERVGPRADVYALGATLRTLLEGRGAQPELEAVAAHATRADPAERYPDAAALSRDLEAWLDGRAVGVYRYSLAERAGRAAWRWRGWIAAGLVAAAVGAAGLGLAGARVVRERDRAVRAEAVATRAREEADADLAASLAREAVARVGEGLFAEAEVLAARSFALRPSPRARGVLMAAAARPRPTIVREPAPCDGERLVGPEGWGCLVEGELRWGGQTLTGVASTDAVALVEGGAWHATLRELTFVDDAGGRRTYEGIGTFRAGHRRAIRWQLDRLALVDPEADGLDERPTCGRQELLVGWGPAEAWAACYPTWLGRYPYEGGGVDVLALPAGRGVPRAVTGAVRGVAVGVDDALLWLDPTTGAVLEEAQLGLGLLRRATSSPDGRFVWVEGLAPGGALLDGASGRLVARLPDAWAGSTLGRGGVLRRATEDAVWTLTPPTGGWPGFRAGAGLATADLSPDGRVLALGDAEGTVHLVDARDGRALARRRVGEGVVKWVTFDPDGERVLAATIDRAAPAVLEVTGGLAEGGEGPGPCRRLLWLRGGAACLTYGRAGPAWLGSDAPPAPRTDELVDLGETDGAVGVVLSAGGEVARVSGPGDEVVIARVAGAERVHAAAGRVVVATADRVDLLDLEGARWASWAVPDGLLDVALSPSGEWVAAGFLDGAARLWSASGELLAVLEGGHEERVANVVFGPDVLVTAGWDGRAHLWGLGPLRAAPAPEDVERAWGLSLDDVAR